MTRRDDRPEHEHVRFGEELRAQALSGRRASARRLARGRRSRAAAARHWQARRRCRARSRSTRERIAMGSMSSVVWRGERGERGLERCENACDASVRDRAASSRHTSAIARSIGRSDEKGRAMQTSSPSGLAFAGNDPEIVRTRTGRDLGGEPRLARAALADEHARATSAFVQPAQITHRGRTSSVGPSRKRRSIRVRAREWTGVVTGGAPSRSSAVANRAHNRGGGAAASRACARGSSSMPGARRGTCALGGCGCLLDVRHDDLGAADPR